MKVIVILLVFLTFDCHCHRAGAFIPSQGTIHQRSVVVTRRSYDVPKAAISNYRLHSASPPARCPFPSISTSTKLSSSLSDWTSDEAEHENDSNRLDTILATLTSGFPFFVLGSAILALCRPSLLLWTNKGDLITLMLALVMWGTGLTLTKDDFTVVLQKDLASIPVGVLCQFLIMPMTAFTIGKTLLLNSSSAHGSALFLGLCLVGCSPGGTASNLVALIAKADVALSVLLTSCSTILASIATPLLVKLLVGSTIAISGWTLCLATARVVLLPVLLGMLVNTRAPKLASRISRFTPFASVVLVALICGGVVAENAPLLFSTTSSGSMGLIPLIVFSVLSLHAVGFLAGYLVPRRFFGFGEVTSRTISIETGMQNSALAVVLARSIGAPSIASLPGALSATAHSCMGSILAAYWRGADKRGDDEAKGGI